MYVPGHVRVELTQRGGERLVAAAARHLAILDPAEFVVLLPKVSLENLRRGQKAQNRRVSMAEVAPGKRRSDRQSRAAEHRGAQYAGSGTGYERASAGQWLLGRRLRRIR